jgi:hypothetical protein
MILLMVAPRRVGDLVDARSYFCVCFLNQGADNGMLQMKEDLLRERGLLVEVEEFGSFCRWVSVSGLIGWGWV